MTQRQITTDRAPAPAGRYSQAIEANGLVFVAGQGPIHPETGEITGDGIASQTRLTLANIEAILEEAGSSMDRVVKTTVHLADRADFPGFNEVFAAAFSDPPPVRTTTISGLMGILVEIDVIALAGRGE
ncbi:MAG: RidA family protein [Actinomycetota bacterium]